MSVGSPRRLRRNASSVGRSLVSVYTSHDAGGAFEVQDHGLGCERTRELGWSCMFTRQSKYCSRDFPTGANAGSHPVTNSRVLVVELRSAIDIPLWSGRYSGNPYSSMLQESATRIYRKMRPGPEITMFETGLKCYPRERKLLVGKGFTSACDSPTHPTFGQLGDGVKGKTSDMISDVNIKMGRIKVNNSTQLSAGLNAVNRDEYFKDRHRAKGN
ncbi:hypothetical protein BD779DRAFT_1478734 [Infundibulicybe gibba]|nr:hypothetical protein BD779DRAFT_1478734 [Infundibulicybe gibba]